MQSHLSILVLVLFFIGCSVSQPKEENSESLTTIKVTEKDIQTNVKASDVVKIDSLLFLETTEDGLIGTIDKVLVTNNRIYILDTQTANGIFCFDRCGNFINSYKNEGRGPEEYTSLHDMDCFENKVYITASPERVFTFDHNLKLLNTIDVNWPEAIPADGPDITVLNNDTLLFSSLETPFKHNFYCVKKDSFISHASPVRGYKDYYCHPVKIHSSNRLLIAERYKDTIYSGAADKLEPAYIIDFEKPLTQKEKNIKIDESPYLFRKNEKLTMENNEFNKMGEISYFMENEMFISFSFHYTKTHQLFYNKENSEPIIFPKDIENDLFKHSPLFFYPRGVFKTSHISPVQAVTIAEQENTSKFQLPKDFNMDSNPILVFYSPKFY